MTNKERNEKALANLIRKAGPEKPSADLTNSIMEQLSLETALDNQKDTALWSVLKNVEMEGVSEDITRSVLSKLEDQNSYTSLPLLSKKIKYAYGLLMLAGLFYLAINAVWTDFKLEWFQQRIANWEGLKNAKFFMFAVGTLIFLGVFDTILLRRFRMLS